VKRSSVKLGKDGGSSESAAAKKAEESDEDDETKSSDKARTSNPVIEDRLRKLEEIGFNFVSFLSSFR